jgi:predicted O-methyltransferase YrrM
LIKRIEKLSDCAIEYFANLFRYFRWHPPPPLGLLLSKIAKSRLRKEEKTKSTLKDLVLLAFSFRFIPFIPQKKIFEFFTIMPLQIQEEILSLLELLARYRPKTLMEIGTARGATLYLFSKIASPEAIMITIDLPGGPFSGGYPAWKIPLYKSFAKGNQRIYLIRADSHEPETLEYIKKILNNEMLDFLFIDGDHTYKGVKKDFQMYSPLVRNGGLIAFHDIVPGPPENVWGVPKFWKEIKQSLINAEIVKDWNQKGCGIGVLYV